MSPPLGICLVRDNGVGNEPYRLCREAIAQEVASGEAILVVAVSRLGAWLKLASGHLPDRATVLVLDADTVLEPEALGVLPASDRLDWSMARLTGGLVDPLWDGPWTAEALARVREVTRPLLAAHWSKPWWNEATAYCRPPKSIRRPPIVTNAWTMRELFARPGDDDLAERFRIASGESADETKLPEYIRFSRAAD